MKWQYKLIKQQAQASYEDIERMLNEAGAQGWELASIDYGCFIMKRIELSCLQPPKV